MMTLSAASTGKTPGRVRLQNQQSTSSNVKVVVRIRPENTSEHDGSSRIVVKAMNEHVLAFDPSEEHLHTPGYKKSVTRDIRKKPRKDLKFAFDYVFGPHTSNQTVYEQTTKTILDGFLNGYNCSVFAYGATGAGKTHTMLGSADKPGVMFLTMIDLYDRIEAVKEEKSIEVAVSYLEVYNEQIKDLLLPKGTLPIREDTNGVVVSGLSLHKPKTAEELLYMLQYGNENRSQHPTDANAESSRSHAVFQVYVRQKERTANVSAEVKVAKMCLVDLAGSERATVTTNRGARFREGANINRSLLALGNVINSLAENKSKGHVPYRDSKLTRLLKDSLGGNCRTVMIAAVSPSSKTYDDTYNTLKYADRAKNIKATLKKNILSVDFHISKYGQIVEDLRKEIIELKSKLTDFEEGKILSGGTSKHSQNQEIARLQDVLHNVFTTRSSIRKDILDQESSKRDILWKIYKKEKIKSRLDILESNNPQAVDNLNRTVHKNQNKLDRVLKHIDIANTKYTDNTHWLDRVQTEMKLAGGDSKIMPELLEISLRMHNLEVELGDARHHCKHLKKLVKHQEKETEANDKLISLLLKTVKKQYLLLKGHNIATPDILNDYNQIKDEVDPPEVQWADETIQSDNTIQKFNIADIFNLPVVNSLSLKGSTPSRVRNKRRLSQNIPVIIEMNTQTKKAANVLKNSPILAQRVPKIRIDNTSDSSQDKTQLDKPIRNLRQEMENLRSENKENVSKPQRVKNDNDKNIPKDPSLRRAVLKANTLHKDSFIKRSVSSSEMTQLKMKDNVKNNSKCDPKRPGNTKSDLSSYAAKEERVVKPKHSYDISPNTTEDCMTPYATREERPVKSITSYDISSCPEVSGPLTPFAAKEERPIKSRKNYDELCESSESLNSTYIKSVTNNANEGAKIENSQSHSSDAQLCNDTIVLSSPVVLRENKINTTTVVKSAPSIHNETVTKTAPDVIKVPNQDCKKTVARSIVFETTPPSSKGMSYADVVKTPSPVRTPLEQIHYNTDLLDRNSQVTPEHSKINLDTPKYKLSAKCKESLKKLRQNMEKTQSDMKYRHYKPSYMSMTKSSSIRNKLQFNDDTGSITARRVPINTKSLTSGRISKSKSTSSLNRTGWQI